MTIGPKVRGQNTPKGSVVVCPCVVIAKTYLPMSDCYQLTTKVDAAIVMHHRKIS